MIVFRYFLWVTLVPLCISSAFAGSVVAESDFSGLVGHWNFNEGRDWHDHAFPYVNHSPVAQDYVGTNDISMEKRDSSAWISGKQLSGVRFGGDSASVVPFKRTISSELENDFTVSLWIKTTMIGNDTFWNPKGIMGQTQEMQLGTITDGGKIAFVYGAELVAESSMAVNDGQWHNVIFTRTKASNVVEIYVDGRLEAQGALPEKANLGQIKELGKIRGAGEGFVGDIDEIHVFTSVVNEETRKALLENCAPKAYAQDTLVKAGESVLTGSVLHRFTFDPDLDKLSVTRFGQGKFGSVTSNGDGTFNYTGHAGFKGKDSFSVVITDGRGGYSQAEMTVTEEHAVSRMPVKTYINIEKLPLENTDLAFSGIRYVKLVDWDGDGDMDILSGGKCADLNINTLFFHENVGTLTKPSYAAATPLIVEGNPAMSISGTSFTLFDYDNDGRKDIIVHSGGYLNVYRNTGPEKGLPILSLDSAASPRKESGSRFFFDSVTFDMGKVDDDDLPDLVVGDSSGVSYYKNISTTPGKLVFDTTKTRIIGGSYNYSGHFSDINGDGELDLIRGENWGVFEYRLKGVESLISQEKTGSFSLLTKEGKTPMAKDFFAVAEDNKNTLLRELNGTNSDFADINGDGIVDLVLSGYNYSDIFVAYGVDPYSATENLKKIEALYDANLPDLGVALSANNNELLNKYKALMADWISFSISIPSVEGRNKAYDELKAHCQKYDFLQRKTLDVSKMHHVPGIFVQNWTTLFFLKPDSEGHRKDIADSLGFVEGSADREQFMTSGLVVADNAKCSDGQYNSIRDMMKYHPRALFPDDHISIDRIFGDDREAISYTFHSAKNTFGNEVGGASSEWDGDIATAAKKALGPDSVTGCYFTFVMGHEVTHSLDAYVRRCANKDLTKRWGEYLVYAGNDSGRTNVIVPGENGWMDSAATQNKFKTLGLWDTTANPKQTYTEAWDAYWAKGPGSAYNSYVTMRIDIKFFLGSSQESLATQANHHWSGSEGRLVGAIDRFNRGYKSNLVEVLLFLDMQSAGLNKIPMYNIIPQKTPVPRAVYDVDYAWLERNDKGYVNKVTIEDRVYAFTLDDRGKVLSVDQSILAVANDNYTVLADSYVQLTPLLNDSSFLGGKLRVESVSSPQLGEVTQAPDGSFFYKSPKTPGVTEVLSYVVISDKGERGAGKINIVVQGAISSGVKLETWTGINGQLVSNLTSNARYPSSPNTTEYVSTFDIGMNKGDAYGSRMRGCVRIPETGQYYFYVSGDNSAQVKMLAQPGALADAQVIVDLPINNSSRYNWTQKAEQKSAAIALEKDQVVYIDVLHKESGGTDWCAVAWQTPANSTIRLIPEEVFVADVEVDTPVLPVKNMVARGEPVVIDLSEYFILKSKKNSLNYFIVENTGSGEVAVQLAENKLIVSPLNQGQVIVSVVAQSPLAGASYKNTISINVSAPVVPVPTYNWWAEQQGLSGAEMAPSANPSGDGISNLMKYALGLNAMKAESLSPQLLVEEQGENRYMTVTYSRNPDAVGIVYQVESSVDTKIWVLDDVCELIMEKDRVMIKDKEAMPVVGQKFYRLKVAEVL